MEIMLNNKLKMSLLIFLSCFTVQNYAENLVVRSIKEGNIAKQTKRINTLLYRHRMTQSLIIGGVMVANAIELYRACLFVKGFVSGFFTKKIPSNQSEVAQILEKDPNVNFDEKEKNESFLTGLKNFFLCKETGYFALFGFSNVATQKIMKQFWHSESLRWYVRAQAPYRQTSAMIREYVRAIDTTESISPKQRAYYQKTLSHLCNVLIERVENICAFMNYKSEQLIEDKKIMGYSVERYVFNRSNDWAQQVTKLLNQSQPDYQKLIHELNSFEAELTREIKHFSCIEGEVMAHPKIMNSRK